MTTRVMVGTDVVLLRACTAADAPALHRLIGAHVEEGRLIPRTLSELGAHASRFVAVERSQTVIACAELAPLSSSVAEIRSLVVEARARGEGLASRMVHELTRRARHDGFGRVCAFAHDPGFFVGLGFSIVPHAWVPEKIAHDCAGCPLFRTCGQHALVLDRDAPIVWPVEAADRHAVNHAH